MSKISQDPIADAEFREYHRQLHLRLSTPRHQLQTLMHKWGIGHLEIGERNASGEATEVYKVLIPTQLDMEPEIFGYLRVDHSGLNEFEVELMEACRRRKLPVVDLLNAQLLIPVNGAAPKDIGVTLLAPARGKNLQEAYEHGLLEPNFGMQVISNAAKLLSQIHEISRDDFRIRALCAKHLGDYSPEIAYSLLADVKSMLQDHHQFKDQLDLLQRQIGVAVETAKGAMENTPPIVIHADFDMKHIYYDENTAEISSLIDFGGAKFGFPHMDLVHWKTFSSGTFDIFLEEYLNRTLGDDSLARESFINELEAFNAIFQLRALRYRAHQGLLNEVDEHLKIALASCEHNRSHAPNIRAKLSNTVVSLSSTSSEVLGV